MIETQLLQLQGSWFDPELGLQLVWQVLFAFPAGSPVSFYLLDTMLLLGVYADVAVHTYVMEKRGPSSWHGKSRHLYMKYKNRSRRRCPSEPGPKRPEATSVGEPEPVPKRPETTSVVKPEPKVRPVGEPEPGAKYSEATPVAKVFVPENLCDSVQVSA